MTTPSSTLLQVTQTLAFAGLLALGLAACASAPEPIGEAQQPISGDGSGESTDADDDACASGVAPAEADEGECTITARGLCFTSEAAACACGGCGLDECAIAESFPAQAFCPSSGGGSEPDGPVSDDPDAPVSSEPGAGSDGSPGTSVPGSSGCGTPAHAGPADPRACDEGHAPSAEGPCDFVVGDTCFESAQSACMCAGCQLDECLVLESYPAQIRCP